MTAAANCKSDEYDEFKEKVNSLALIGNLGSVLDQLLKRNCSCSRLEQALLYVQMAKNSSADGASTVSLYCEPFPIELPWWLAALYLSLFCLIILLAVGGNLTVVWIVLGHQRMRTVTNYFLVNLAIADASISVMNVGFSSAYNLYYDWRFGVTYCYINNFMGITPTCASVFTMMAMTFDRYIAIVYPLRPRLSKKKTLIAIALIWLVAILVGLPQFFVTRVHWGHFYDPKSKQLHSNTFCYSDNFPNLLLVSGDALNNIYAHLLFTAQYLVPLLVLSVTYILVAITLWGSQPIGDHHQSENIEAKRKVVKMLGAVVAIFMICWFPYQLYFVFLQKFMSSLIPQKAAAILYVNMYGLAMSSTVFNPFIYCWMNSRFRVGFKYVFRWLPFIKMSRDEYRNSTLFDPRRSSRLGTFSTTTPAANTPFAVSSNTRRPSPADRKASAPVGVTNRRRNRLDSRKSGQLNMKGGGAVSVDEANENNNLLSEAPNLRRATTYDRPAAISNEPLLEATVEAVELSNF